MDYTQLPLRGKYIVIIAIYRTRNPNRNLTSPRRSPFPPYRAQNSGWELTFSWLRLSISSSSGSATNPFKLYLAPSFARRPDNTVTFSNKRGNDLGCEDVGGYDVTLSFRNKKWGRGRSSRCYRILNEFYPLQKTNCLGECMMRMIRSL